MFWIMSDYYQCQKDIQQITADDLHKLRKCNRLLISRLITAHFACEIGGVRPTCPAASCLKNAVTILIFTT